MMVCSRRKCGGTERICFASCRWGITISLCLLSYLSNTHTHTQIKRFEFASLSLLPHQHHRCRPSSLGAMLSLQPFTRPTRGRQSGSPPHFRVVHHGDWSLQPLSMFGHYWRGNVRSLVHRLHLLASLRRHCRQHHRKQHQQYGFYQELVDQIASAGTKNLTHAHFLGPVG